MATDNYFVVSHYDEPSQEIHEAKEGESFIARLSYNDSQDEEFDTADDNSDESFYHYMRNNCAESEHLGTYLDIWGDIQELNRPITVSPGPFHSKPTSMLISIAVQHKRAASKLILRLQKLEASAENDTERHVIQRLKRQASEAEARAYREYCAFTGAEDIFQRKNTGNDVLSPTVGQEDPHQLPLGPTTVSAKFSKVQYGTFRNRPACFLGLDLTLRAPKKTSMDFATVKVTYGGEDKHDASSDPYATELFAPKQASGTVTEEPDTQDGEFNLEVTEEKLSRPRKDSAYVKSDAIWQIRGRLHTCTGHEWTVGSREDQSIAPQQFRLGMVVQHLDKPFVARLALEGCLNDLSGESKKDVEFKPYESDAWVFRPATNELELTEKMVAEFVDEVNGTM